MQQFSITSFIRTCVNEANLALNVYIDAVYYFFDLTVRAGLVANRNRYNTGLKSLQRLRGKKFQQKLRGGGPVDF